jgi:PiT family inorganic phosphate transporter
LRLVSSARSWANASSSERIRATHPLALVALIVLAVAYTAITGATDGGNLIAAAAASRTIPVPRAVVIIAVGVLAGPLLFGTAVASTIGTGIADYARLGPLLLGAGIVGAIGAQTVAFLARVPTSGSVALVGAMVGSLWAGPGLGVVHWRGVASPLAGFAAGALVYAMLIVLLMPLSRMAGERVMRLQYLGIALQALGYGANDAEKTVGLLAAAAVVAGGASSFAIPFWAIALTALAFAAGMALGGLRIAKTVGNRLFSIRPQHALAFQFAAAATVLGAAAFGGPVSTTQTTASAIIGVGASDNRRALHWRTAAKIIVSWFLTAPIAFGAGAAATALAHLLLPRG